MNELEIRAHLNAYMKFLKASVEASNSQAPDDISRVFTLGPEFDRGVTAAAQQTIDFIRAILSDNKSDIDRVMRMNPALRTHFEGP